MTKSSSYDNHVLLRRYQPADHDQVRRLFQTGLESTYSAAWRSTLTAPPLLLSMLLLSGAVGWWAVSYSTTTTTALPLDLAGVAHHDDVEAIMTSDSSGMMSSSAVLVFVAVVLLTLAASCLFIGRGITKGLKGYVASCLQKDDLQSAERMQQVYTETTKNGGGGVFLVAVTTRNDDERIVGMVGGAVKQRSSSPRRLSSSSSKRRRSSLTSPAVVIEVRRMTVDPAFQGRGIGTRLLQRLQQELVQAHTSTSASSTDSITEQSQQQLVLSLQVTCTNFSHAARRLFSRAGFASQTEPIKVGDGFLARQGISLTRYEKQLFVVKSSQQKQQA